MALQLQLEKAKYRQWAKAGLGLGYLKEGLAPFCQDIANQQHKDMLVKIQQTNSLTLPVTCGKCQLRTLKPDHVKTGTKVCPYGQANCNCWFPSGKSPCPCNICGAMYDDIIKSHTSTPPAPNWKNTDSQMWTTDPWSIAKCFINAPGYDQKTSAADTDCTGLLHVIINNKYFHNHIAVNLTGASIFSKVRQYRNEIFHSSSMELDETTVNSYLDDMISVLQERQELVHHPGAQQAVNNLQELKKKDFLISSESFEELLKQIREEMVDVLNSTESTKEECERLKKKLSSIEELLKQTKDEMAKSTESTNEEYVSVKRRVFNIETLVSEQREEIQRLGIKDSPEQKQLECEKAKSELRDKIIQEYHKTVLKVPAMPLLPDETCEFSQIYVRPKIVSEVKDENRETKETEIKSMSEIFRQSGVSLKSVYVVGDAGTGKSSFCKYLVNCWCIEHSEGQIVEDEFDGVNEMKKFDFLFLISLRHNQNIDSIHEMLKNQYDIDILGTLLEKESSKMLVLLDGLDEWSSESKTYCQFQTVGLPKRGVCKDYTIVTTSRPWKIHILKIRDSEIQQMLKLKGFDSACEREMVKRTISNIKPKKGENKDISDCWRKLREESLRSLKQVPFMLQQLICLWFDGKLDKTSRCDVYTEMLELFFTWNDDKTVGTSSRNIEVSQNMELPECLADKEMCELNRHLIYNMSRLAYETLFNCTKDKALTFDISIFRKLKISDERRENCLKLGILTNDKCPSLSVSERPKAMFSFIQKSVQEFLAAVNIAINFINKMSSLNKLEDADLQIECIQFINEVFKNCSKVNEILEQSNVIIMLCGLEPRLATHVTRYIYVIVKDDPLVQRYRRTVDSDFRLSIYYNCLLDIQNLIFDSMKECSVYPKEKRPTFYNGDLIIDRWDKYSDFVCSSIDQQQIIPDFVHSIYVDDINTRNVKISKYLPKFKHLEKIQINYVTQGLSSSENVELRIDEVNNSVAETIKLNVSTLKSLSLKGGFYTDSLCKVVVRILHSMHNIVAIQMTSVRMSHDDSTRFYQFLEGKSHIEQIHVDIRCKCMNRHNVDLTKHQQLQYLNLNNCTCLCVTDIDTVSLEVFKCKNVKSTNYIKIFDSIRKCDKLKELELCIDCSNKSLSFHNSITERLVTVLPLLHNLSQLNLYRLRFTDNIIQVPSEMKSLRHINLSVVTISLTKWREFVDSLPSIPHTVNVMLSCCYITRDDDNFNVNLLSLLGGGGEKGNEAKQYVKDRKPLFYVKLDDPYCFLFSTKSDFNGT